MDSTQVIPRFPDLERERAELALLGLDVDDSALGPIPVITISPPAPIKHRQAGRIRYALRPPTPWHMDARCRGYDPDLFYPTRHSSAGDVREAKGICYGCPVRWDCLRQSVLWWEKQGIWGGFAEIERREVRRDLRLQGANGSVDLDDHDEVLRYLASKWGGSTRPVPRGAGAASCTRQDVCTEDRRVDSGSSSPASSTHQGRPGTRGHSCRTRRSSRSRDHS